MKSIKLIKSKWSELFTSNRKHGQNVSLDSSLFFCCTSLKFVSKPKIKYFFAQNIRRRSIICLICFGSPFQWNHSKLFVAHQWQTDHKIEKKNLYNTSIVMEMEIIPKECNASWSLILITIRVCFGVISLNPSKRLNSDCGCYIVTRS